MNHSWLMLTIHWGPPRSNMNGWDLFGVVPQLPLEIPSFPAPDTVRKPPRAVERPSAWPHAELVLLRTCGVFTINSWGSHQEYGDVIFLHDSWWNYNSLVFHVYLFPIWSLAKHHRLKFKEPCVPQSEVAILGYPGGGETTGGHHSPVPHLSDWQSRIECVTKKGGFWAVFLTNHDVKWQWPSDFAPNMLKKN